MKTWQLAIGLGTVFIIGIIVVTIVHRQLPPESIAILDIEIAKAALVGCIVAVIGAVIGALVKAREQRVQAVRLQADLLSQFIQQLGEHYRSVKATRRRLRAIGLTTRFGNPPEKLNDEQLKAYEGCMETIETSQLAIEDFKIRFRMSPQFTDMTDVAPWLKIMESYLRILLKEREEKMAQVRSGASISFAELVRLNEFTADADEKTSPIPPNEGKPDYRFKSHFAHAYDCIWERISQNLKNLTDV